MGCRSSAAAVAAAYSWESSKHVKSGKTFGYRVSGVKKRSGRYFDFREGPLDKRYTARMSAKGEQNQGKGSSSRSAVSSLQKKRQADRDKTANLKAQGELHPKLLRLRERWRKRSGSPRTVLHYISQLGVCVGVIRRGSTAVHACACGMGSPIAGRGHGSHGCRNTRARSEKCPVRHHAATRQKASQ